MPPNLWTQVATALCHSNPDLASSGSHCEEVQTGPGPGRIAAVRRNWTTKCG